MRKTGYCFLRLMFLAALIGAVSGCTGRLEKRTAAVFFDYYSYRDIPGVSAEEIDAVEWIKTQRDSFVYTVNSSTEAFWNDDGSIGGYSALFCQWLSDLFGIPFRPAIAEWDELIAGLASLEIDFSGELTATAERRKTYAMTGAIAERPIKIMRILDSEPLPILEKTRLLRYAFLEGTTAFDLVSPFLHGDFEAFFVNDYDTAYHALKNETIDAFFEDGPAEAAFDIYGDVYAEDFFPLIYGPVSLATQNPGFAAFISVVQKALDAGAVHHLTKLYNQGYRDYLRRRLALQLTDVEKEYISLHNTRETAVKIAAEYDNYPSSFYNSHDKEWQGVSIDVLREIEDLTGLLFEVENRSYTEWPQLVQMLESGQVSMITELFMVQEREDRFIWADVPYQQDFYALLSAVEYENINVNEVLYSRVGLIDGSAYAGLFCQWFPQHTNTVEYVSNIDALNGLARGEVDLVMATKNQLLSIVNYLERPGFKTNIVFNHPSDSYFGFNINETVLSSVISKTQRLIPADEICNRWERRVFDYRRKMAQAQRPWLIGASALLFCVLFLVFIMLQRNRREGRRLELLVSERTQELVAASHAKSEFLANMSHEIRTPINAVTGMTAIARSSSDLNRIYDCLDKINLASRQLLGLINDILDMSKIESKRFELAHEPFSLEAMARNVSSIIGVRAAEKKQRFSVDLAPDLPEVVIGDEIRFSQILINLLSNAVKFTHEGGAIHLSLKCLDTQRLNAQRQNAAGKERIEIVVRDSGIGISAEQQKRLFNAFVQAESGTAKRFGGTGLGLAISKSLAELMGGGISIESALGEGSCFTVQVMLDPGSRDMLKMSQTRESSECELSGYTLLLAEDIPINREIVIALLEDTHAAIDCAENGQEAVHMFCANPARYDLIFMDVQMPMMDGYDATRAIRAFESKMKTQGTMPLKHPNGIPIIAMTANAFAEDVEHCLNVGMNGHIAKPIEVETLLSITDNYLSARNKSEFV